MHTTSYNGMQKAIATWMVKLPAGAIVLDVGAMDVNGNYRALFKQMPVKYVGADLAKGPNVDLVMPAEYSFGLKEASVHAVISGQCLEHCRNPFKLVAEIYRVCAPGAVCILVAPRTWKEHKHPWDCFRYLADGMSSILSEAGFKVVKAWVSEPDCWGVGVKEKKAA
jgi:SAM-dependent methyltransferase